MISDIDYSNDELRQMCSESATLYAAVKAAIKQGVNVPNPERQLRG